MPFVAPDALRFFAFLLFSSLSARFRVGSLLDWMMCVAAFFCARFNSACCLAGLVLRFVEKGLRLQLLVWNSMRNLGAFFKHMAAGYGY